MSSIWCSKIVYAAMLLLGLLVHMPAEPAPPSAALDVVSAGVSGVAITSSTGHGGTTDYTISGIPLSTSVILKAPLMSGGRNFRIWLNCDSVSGNYNEYCHLVMDTNRQVTAVYWTPADDFVTTWRTDNAGASGTSSIVVSMIGGPYEVDWNNDNIFDETVLSGSVSHTFGSMGIYTIRIRGAFDSIKVWADGDQAKILRVDQWGTHTWTSMMAAFDSASNLTVPAADTPDFSAVTDMSGMFSFATVANPDTSKWDTSAVEDMAVMFAATDSADPDTSDWDTSAVTDMEGMFSQAASANPDTSNWDTSSVRNMRSMFNRTAVANPDTSKWDTSAVEDMRHMFAETTMAEPDTSNWDTAAVTTMLAMFSQAGLANPDTSGWDTSSVNDMSHMFQHAVSANPDTRGWDTSKVTEMYAMFGDAVAAMPDTSNWDTSKVTDMAYMFNDTTLANPDTSGWDTSMVTDMEGMFSNAIAANPDVRGWDTSLVSSMIAMFSGATAFDRDIGSWDVTALTHASNMFLGVTLSTFNYDGLLIGWGAQTLQPGVVFHGGNSNYCADIAIERREKMLDAVTGFSWSITDAGLACPAVTCKLTVVSGEIVDTHASYHACETLVIGPSFLVSDGARAVFSSGLDIQFWPLTHIQKGATMSSTTCGQSLCSTSASAMTYGCHPCVTRICETDPSCCTTGFDSDCVTEVTTICGMHCD